MGVAGGMGLLSVDSNIGARPLEPHIASNEVSILAVTVVGVFEIRAF